MSENSILTENIPDSLTNDDNTYVVRLMDQTNSRIATEFSVKLDNVYDFNLTNYVPNDQVCDLERFFEIASGVINEAQTRAGTVSAQRVNLVEDFNPERFHDHGSEVITYKVIKRAPAKMNTSATSRPQRSYSPQYDLRFAEHPNKVITVESRPIDHVIEFSAWAKTASLANKRVLWLERLLIDQSWAFKSKGVEKFYWTERLSDTFFSAGGQRLYYRSLRFFVRLREFRSLANPAIRNFDFEVTISDN